MEKYLKSFLPLAVLPGAGLGAIAAVPRLVAGPSTDFAGLGDGGWREPRVAHPGDTEKCVWPHPAASPYSLGGSFSTSLLQELKPSLQPGVAHGKFIYSLLFLPASPLSLNSSSPSLVLTPDVFIESNQICTQHRTNQARVIPPWDALTSAWLHV